MTASTLARIGFAGTPAFSATILDTLIDAGRTPVAVWTQPDRRAGRGRKLAPSDVKQRALAANIPVLQPTSLKDPDARAALAECNLDLLIVVAYGLLLPQTVLDAPRLGCINVHASTLPRWRGAAPIQAAIAAGDETTGVCIMQMDAGLDTGPVLLHAALPIAEEATAGSLTTALADLGAATLVDALDLLERGELAAEPQDDALATYAGRISKGDAELDFGRTALELERQVRAFDPWPVCYTHQSGERLRIWKAQLANGPASTSARPNNEQVTDDRQTSAGPNSDVPGIVLDVSPSGIDVATRAGVLRLLEVQRAGGKRLPVAEYIRAHAPAIGSVLGFASQGDAETVD